MWNSWLFQVLQVCGHPGPIVQAFTVHWSRHLLGLSIMMLWFLRIIYLNLNISSIRALVQKLPRSSSHMQELSSQRKEWSTCQTGQKFTSSRRITATPTICFLTSATKTCNSVPSWTTSQDTLLQLPLTTVSKNTFIYLTIDKCSQGN